MKNICLLLLVILTSCTKRECCFIIPTSLLISVLDANDKDLLDPVLGSIDAAAIKVFYQVEPEIMEEVNNPELRHPAGYWLSEPPSAYSDNYLIVLSINRKYLDDDHVSYTHIQWPDGNIDEVRAQYERTENSYLVRKMWVNDELRWESGGNPRLITQIND